MHCHRLVTIPTDPAASSLNLAQAVLLLSYACANAVRALQHGERQIEMPRGGKVATAAEQERWWNRLRMYCCVLIICTATTVIIF